MTLTLLTAVALGFEPMGANWAAEDLPVPYWLHADIPGDLDPDEAEAAVRAAFSAWEEASCGIPFAYQGRLEDTAFGGMDGLNVVYILQDDWPDDPPILSVPMIAISGDDIVEADIALNAEYFQWTTQGDQGLPRFDVQATVTHEVGHVVGLTETEVEGASMNPLLNGREEARTLSEDDINGLCAVYAEEDLSTFGGTCLESDNCAGGQLCLDDGIERYCTQHCDHDEACPSDYECASVKGEGQVCARERRGCACASGPASPHPLVSFLLAVGVLGRRRSSRTGAESAHRPTAERSARRGSPGAASRRTVS